MSRNPGRSRPLAVAALAALSLTAGACAQTGTNAGSLRAQSNSAGGGYLTIDGDHDFDDRGPHVKGIASDDRIILGAYPRTADPAARRAIASAVERYYAAAARGDGATVCSLLDTSLVSTLEAGGSSCPAAATSLLRTQNEPLLAANAPTMRVTAVRLNGSRGLAVLAFKTMPEGDMILIREGSGWKMEALLAGDMP